MFGCAAVGVDCLMAETLLGLLLHFKISISSTNIYETFFLDRANNLPFTDTLLCLPTQKLLEQIDERKKGFQICALIALLVFKKGFKYAFCVALPHTTYSVPVPLTLVPYLITIYHDFISPKDHN